MTAQDITRSIRYGAHYSVTKETTFVRTELVEQARAGHISLFPLRAVLHLPRLWISPIAAISQQGRKTCLVYDFSWSEINEAITQVSHKEAMLFGKAIYIVIDFILAAPPKLDPIFLKKLDLADAHMHIWVRLEDILSVAFLVPKSTPEEDQLIGFHLLIPMGCVESAAFFCATTNTVKERALDTLSTRHTARSHHLKDLAETKPPQSTKDEAAATLKANSNREAMSPHAQATSLAHAKLYLNDFIDITQGGPTKRQQMIRHLFHAIDEIFRPNNKDSTAREEPIYLKKLCKGNTAWST